MPEKAERQAIIQLPKLSGDARKRWDQLQKSEKVEILESAWCSGCTNVTSLQLRDGKMSGRSLVLTGTCKKCGGEAARVVEPED